MSITYTQSAPDLNLIPPSEMRHYLRIDTQDEDELLLMLSRTAATHVEDIIGRALMRRQVTVELDGYPASGVINLPLQPVISVDEIQHDAGGNTTILPAAAYRVVTAHDYTQIMRADGVAWPDVTEPGSVRVIYHAGSSVVHRYPGADTVVDTAAGWPLVRAPRGDYHKKSQELIDIKLGVDRLLAPYKTVRV